MSAHSETILSLVRAQHYWGFEKNQTEICQSRTFNLFKNKTENLSVYKQPENLEEFEREFRNLKEPVD